MFRTFGWKPALAVLALDVAKGYLPAFLAPGLAAGGSAAPPSTLGLAAGVAAVLGHCYPLFARFRGGKGVATGAGAFLAVHPGAVAVGFGVFAALLALTRYVSAASVAAAAAMPAALLAFGAFGYAAPPPDLWLAAALAGFIAFTHRSNLSRLSRGVEPRVGAGGGPAADADAAGTTTGRRLHSPAGPAPRGAAADADAAGTTTGGRPRSPVGPAPRGAAAGAAGTTAGGQSCSPAGPAPRGPAAGADRTTTGGRT